MRWSGLCAEDKVVIPALNEESSIGIGVRYLFEHGLRGDQLMIVDSGCTDRTVAVVLETANAFPKGSGVQIVRVADVLGSYRHSRAGGCGIARCVGELPCTGKGAAMYAAIRRLTEKDHPPQSRIFFLDGDIRNPEEVDPIGHLLKAWEKNPRARVAKLAAEDRQSQGLMGFANTLPSPYRLISHVAWPLCGQQSLFLADLQRMPMPTGYSVEVAMMAAIAEQYGEGCFTQQAIPAPLLEEKHPDDLQRSVRMMSAICHFLLRMTEYGPVHTMSHRDICRWNNGSRAVENVGIPSMNGEPCVREVITIEALLPPVVSRTTVSI